MGLGVEGWSVDECIHQFANLCDTAFTPRELQGVPLLRQLTVINHKYSKYKTRPLEGVLQSSFSVSDEPLFGGQHSQSGVKVAVTATTDTASQAVVMTNYNRPQLKDDQCKHSFLMQIIVAEGFQPPITGSRELRSLKMSSTYGRRENTIRTGSYRHANFSSRARATSAAPSFFKTFKSKRNSRGYLDGALYHNNPVRVADLERRLIWPDTENSQPDVLLSIGTSCNNTIFKEAQETLRFQRRGHDSGPERSIAVAQGGSHRLFSRKSKGTQTSKMIKIMKNRVENILDTETSWLKFMSDAARGNQEDRARYRRINPDIGVEPPKLDEAKMLPSLQRRMHQMTKDGAYQKQVGEVARQLVASCFYVETSNPLLTSQELPTTVTGMSFVHRNKFKLIFNSLD